MYGRVVTTRGSAQRTRTRPEHASRPVNHENPGERVLGGLSREEARQLQTLKYTEDSKKFVEKEKQKAQKKKEERWKRYSHVDLGHRLNSDDQEFEYDVETIRDQQQLTYDVQSAEGLEWEREREDARARREVRQKKEKLKKYSYVTSGQQLGSSERTSGSCSEEIIARQKLQSEYDLQSAENLEREQQKEAAQLQQNRERKLRKYEHVDVGRRLNTDDTFSPSSSHSADVYRLERQVNYDLAMEQKTKHYQGKKLETETASLNYTSTSESSTSQMNNLNAPFETEEEITSTISQTDKDNEHRERMKLARERLQSKYNAELHKSS